MNLNDVLDHISKNKKIKIERVGDNDVRVFIKIDGMTDILRIYPKTKTAEFLDIEEEWEELIGAVEAKYKNFSEIKVLVAYLNANKYDIIF